MAQAVLVHLLTGQTGAELILLGVVVALVGLARGPETIVRAGFVLMGIGGAVTVAAFASGAPAAAELQAAYALDQQILDAHREVAEFAAVAAALTGAAALICLWFSRGLGEVNRVFAGMVLVLALPTLGLAGYTVYKGKQISHPEVVPAAPAPAPAEPAVPLEP